MSSEAVYPTRHRVRSLSLILALAIIEGLTIWTAYKPYDVATSLLAILGVLLILAVLTSLLCGKGDWIFRGSLLVLVIGYIAFKLFVLWGFLTQVD